MMPSFLNRNAHFLPGLIILAVGMFALHTSVRLSEEQTILAQYEDILSAQYASLIGQENPPESRHIKTLSMRILNREQWLYWSVIAMSLTGFLLFVLNADKLRKLEDMIAAREQAAAEKKDIQDQLSQAQKMEAIGRLAGGIAHDFNNILAAMNGNAEFLTEDLEKESPQHKFAVNILQAGRQARSLIDEILTFSRRDDNEIEQIDLCNPLRESLSLLQATVPKSIEFETNIELDSAMIDANSTQISQMIMNLCVNACDAIDEDKGTISISLLPIDITKEISLNFLNEELPDPQETPLIKLEEKEPNHTFLRMGSASRNHDYVKLSVGDSGSGMSKVIMERIFEPFFTTKDIHKGTGLGLATVHGTIIAHRGVLMIDSVVGKGTRFDLLFPLSKAAAVQKTKTEEYKHAPTGGFVLLVEDQEDVRIVTQTMLTRLGYDVETAPTGFEALDILRETPEKFDIVLTDQNMLKMTGFELINEAYEDFPGLPFVFLSGYSEEKLKSLMEEHPAIKAVMRKPVSQKDLGQTLSQVLMAAGTRKTAAA